MAAGVVSGGQEIAWERHGAGIRDGTARGFSEVRGRLNAYEFCRLDQAVEERGGSGSTLRATAVMILPAHCQCSQPALHVVSIERDVGVLEESAQPWPEPERVLDGFTVSTRPCPAGT